jgi:ABC-type sugar transport system substrate-binding protein
MKKLLSNPIAVAIAFGVVVVMIGASIASAAAGPSGTVVADTAGKWVKYNSKSCKYVPAKSLGAKYRASMRKAPTGTKISWGTQDTVFPFTLLLNKDINKQAKAAGVHLRVWDNKGDNSSLNTTEPVKNAEQIVAWKPAVNLWMNTYGPLTPKTMGMFNKAKPCIPTIQFYIAPGKNAIYFGNSQPQQGIAAANHAAPLIKKRGWDLKQTWIVSTGQESAFGNDPGSPQERITYFTKQLQKLLPGIPKNQVTLLDCADTPTCRTAMADWLTAHPQARYVTGATVYDIRSLGAHAALKAAGFGDRAILVGNGLEPAAKALVDAGDPIMVATLDPGEQNGGKFVIPLALDILAGKAVPTATYIPVKPYCGKRCAR